MTRERLQEMEQEVHELKTKGRKEMAVKIADARSHGDLSENADYDAAKHEQELMEIKIAKLEGILSKAQIIDPKDFPDDHKIYILSKIKLKNKKNNAIIEYVMVSAEEADFEKNKLSVTSPLGKVLMGKEVGDIVQTKVPAGVIEYEVLEVNRSV
jgi:transcription elongation factor GreA